MAPNTSYYPTWYHPIWDPVKHILTVEGDNAIEDLVQIGFELGSGTNSYNFSVFIRAQNAIVRKGSSFSELQRREFCEYLERKSQNQDDDDPIIMMSDGNARVWYRIVVKIDKNVVFWWCIYNVSVNLVRSWVPMR